MIIDLTTKLDSEEGIRRLMKWARAHRFVLYPYHRKIAEKYNVTTDGVLFADPIPFNTPSPSALQ